MPDSEIRNWTEFAPVDAVVEDEFYSPSDDEGDVIVVPPRTPSPPPEEYEEPPELWEDKVDRYEQSRLVVPALGPEWEADFQDYLRRIEAGQHIVKMRRTSEMYDEDEFVPIPIVRWAPAPLPARAEPETADDKATDLVAQWTGWKISAKKKAASQKAASQKAASQKAASQKPAAPPADKTPTEKAPTEKAPTEKAPTKEPLPAGVTACPHGLACQKIKIHLQQVTNKKSNRVCYKFHPHETTSSYALRTE